MALDGVSKEEMFENMQKGGGKPSCRKTWSLSLVLLRKRWPENRRKRGSSRARSCTA
jgi:hypothetical protein